MSEGGTNSGCGQSVAPIGVVVIDDNLLALGALERCLGLSSSLEWRGGASSVPEALALIGRTAPDVVLLDVDMPGVDTFSLLERIVALKPRTKVLMFSGFVRHDYVDRALSAGAVGYIIKDEPIAKTLEFIHRAASGECVLSDAAATAFLQTS